MEFKIKLSLMIFAFFLVIFLAFGYSQSVKISKIESRMVTLEGMLSRNGIPAENPITEDVNNEILEDGEIPIVSQTDEAMIEDNETIVEDFEGNAEVESWNENSMTFVEEGGKKIDFAINENTEIYTIKNSVEGSFEYEKITLDKVKAGDAAYFYVHDNVVKEIRLSAQHAVH